MYNPVAKSCVIIDNASASSVEARLRAMPFPHPKLVVNSMRLAWPKFSDTLRASASMPLIPFAVILSWFACNCALLPCSLMPLAIGPSTLIVTLSPNVSVLSLAPAALQMPQRCFSLPATVTLSPGDSCSVASFSTVIEPYSVA